MEAEGVELVALGEGLNNVDVALASKSTEAKEAVDNLIFLSRHPSVTGSNFDKSLPNPESFDTVKTVTFVESSIEEINEGYKQYKCPLCDETDDNASNLFEHISSKHEGSTIKKSISIISSALASEDSQRASRVSYYPFTSTSLQSSISCTSTHPELSTPETPKVVRVLKTSKAERARGERNYWCSACGYPNDSTGNIYKHMRSMHSPCQIEKLGSKFSTSNSNDVESVNISRPPGMNTDTSLVVKVLKSSIEERNAGEALYKCSACGKSSNSTSNLYRHMGIYHKDCVIEKMKPLVMSKTRGYLWEANLLRANSRVVKILRSSPEEMARGEKKYKCSMCDKASECTGNLYAHMDVCHPECTVQLLKPPPEIPLDESDDGNIVRVITAVRNGKSLYKCSKCPFAGPSTSNLYKHMRRKHKGFTIIKKTRELREAVYNAHKKKILVKENFVSKNSDNDIDDEMDTLPEGQGSDTAQGDYDVNDFQSYECCVCMKTFSNCSDLDTHVKIHEDGDSNKSQYDYDSDDAFGSEDIEDDENEAISKEAEDEEMPCQDAEMRGRGDSEEETREVSVLNKVGSSHSHRRVNTLLASEDFEVEEAENGDTLSLDQSLGSIQHSQRQLIDNNAKAADDSLGEKCKIVKIIKTAVEGNRGDKSYSYRCSECNEGSNTTGNLYRHMRRLHKDCVIEKITDNPVRDNGARSSKRDCIVKIIVVPANQRKNVAGRYSCSECGYANDSSTDLYSHMKLQHKGFIIERVLIDDRNVRPISRTVRVLKVLRRPSVGGSKMYRCSQCSFGSNSVGATDNHIKICHKGLVVGKLKDLTLTHSKNTVYVIKSSPLEKREGFKEYSCSQCSYSKDTACSLYRHMKYSHPECVIEKIQHSDQWEDSDGDKEDIEEDNIAYVISIPNGGRRAFYKCSKCGLSSKNTSNLYKHMHRIHKDCVVQRIHEIEHNNCGGNDPSTPCPPDNTEGENTVHVVKFPGDMRPVYKCSKCGFKGNLKSNLYKHMKRMHKGCIVLTERFNEIRDSDSCGDNDSDISLSDGPVVCAIDIPTKKGCLYKCSKCSRISNHTGNLYKHMSIAHSECTIVKKSQLKSGSGSRNSHNNDSYVSDDLDLESSEYS